MGEMSKVGEVALAIAKRNGDEYDNIPLDKTDWKSANGMFGGVFRDLNQPTQVDYDEMARAAIEALRVPTEAMLAAGNELGRDMKGDPGADWHWQVMIDEALKE